MASLIFEGGSDSDARHREERTSYIAKYQFPVDSPLTRGKPFLSNELRHFRLSAI